MLFRSEAGFGVDAQPDLAPVEVAPDAALPFDGASGEAATSRTTVRFGYPDITTADPDCVVYPETECRPVLGNYLLGEQITIDAPVLLTKLAANVLEVGGKVVMALYTDAGDVPGGLVAATPIASLGRGANEIPVVTPVDLAPGKYWLMALYDVETQIALKKPYTRIWYVRMPFSTELPTAFPGQGDTVRSYQEKYFGYYVVGEQ